VSDIKRKKNESFEAFFRRVKQQWLRSGKILQVRKVKFFTKKKSKNEQRKRAVGHSKIVSKTKYLQKTGKLPPDDDKRNSRRRR
jgi:ribosomal protein S21